MDFDIEFQEVCCPAIILFGLCLPQGVEYNIAEQKQNIKFRCTLAADFYYRGGVN